MEPGHEQQTQQQAAPGQWGAEPAEPPKPVRARDAMARGRTGLVLLIAFLTELIVIAAADNQWVSDKIRHLQIDPNSRVQQGLRSVGLVFAWRFTPRHGDSAHMWAGSLLLIGVTFVLSLLLIAAVVRGPVTFGRAFFGSWTAVIVSVFIGGYARALIVDLHAPNQGSRLDQALFGVLAPNSTTFLAGVGLGLIVAIIVGIVAPLTRRGPAVPLETAVPAGTNQPVQGQDFFSGSPDYPPWREERFGPPAPSNVTVGNDQPTTALPNYDRPPEPFHAPPAGPPPGSQSDSPTTALPVDVPGERRTEDATAAMTPVEERGPREKESTAPHEPFKAATPESERTYGSAPRSPYAPNVGAARSPAAEQSAGEQPPDAATAQAHDEPKMAEPQPAQSGGPGDAERAAEPGAPEAEDTPPQNAARPQDAAPPPAAGPQGTAQLPRVPEPEQQGTAQFPRPPDDEDLDPEHR